MTDLPTSGEIPVLTGEAADAVAHRGSHLQIIAAAGSGKTEVVSQRVASLIADGVSADAIVAFTFTEKAAAELKERIRDRVIDRVGVAEADALGQLQVGTIHGYCFRLLQTWVPRYESFSVLDENQLVSLMSREGGEKRLNLARFGSNGTGLFRGIDAFLRSVAVVENELMSLDDLPDGDFKETLVEYYEMLERYRLMTFGLQIVRAVEALEDEETHASVTATMEHLVVDEYQDVNPAQERLIELLAKPVGGADLVVVGDDDQAIYQWRGSKVENIVKFEERYEGVKQFNLLTNRRSLPAIVALANSFAETISNRIPKTMLPDRPEDGSALQIAKGYATEEEEADFLALTIKTLVDRGASYGSVAVLVRGKVAYKKILTSFKQHGVPVQPGGRTGLFQQDVAAVLGQTYSWLSDVDWKSDQYGKRTEVGLDELVLAHATTFGLGAEESTGLKAHLKEWKKRVPAEVQDVDLIRDLYVLLRLVGVADWDLTDPEVRNRLGTIARVSAVLADYEAVTRRSRVDPANPGEQVGGTARGEWYYKRLAILIVNYANGNYNDFDGEEDVKSNAVALGTVHGAKGLEWPIVFLPSLTDGRFPSSKTGTEYDWLIPRELFDAARYEGSDDDERRLFYVALTRARDWVSLSSHRRVVSNSVKPSPYLEHAVEHATSTGLPTFSDGQSGEDEADLRLTYSDLAAYRKCPRSYLLRTQLGFMPSMAPELGYGHAVHHIMRAVAERAKAGGKLPKPREINRMLETDFFLPFANKPAHLQMKEAARKLVFAYVNEYPDDLLRTWATERPFELFLDGVVLSGRADVIYDDHDGVADNLAIVDYKTGIDGDVEPLQLQIYADAGRREGLTVGAAFIHELGSTERHDVAVTPDAVAAAELTVLESVEKLREGDFTPTPNVAKCGRCDVRQICKAAKS
jgi:DNA helicase-2/ATP-dependent DNA helicase PcrA